MSPDLLQDLIDLSTDMEKYIKPLTGTKCDSEPPERNIDLLNELEKVKERLKQEEDKQAEIEKRNMELEEMLAKQVDKTNVQEVEEELMLMKKDMEKIDNLRAGYISRDSQTEGSLYVEETGQQVCNCL